MPNVLEHWHRLLRVWTLVGRYTTENKYFSSVLDLFNIPNLYIRKGQPHGHRYGKKGRCREFRTAKQLQERCRKEHYENIHDRFIGDTTFRKTMIELGRSENVILEMDRLASEDHSHIATEEEIAVYLGNWWIRSNVVKFDTMRTRHLTEFKMCCRHIVPPQESGGQEALWKVVTKFLLMVGNGKLPGGIPIRRIHHKDGVSTDRTGKLVQSVNQLIICGMDLKQEFGAQFIVILSVTVNAVYRHRRGV